MMNRASAIIVVIVFLGGLTVQAGGATLMFSDSFNLYGNWQSYLYSATNAQVYTEQVAGNSTYWRPTTTGVVGTVEYEFPLSFQATSGTLTAGIAAFTSGDSVPDYDPNAYAYLDVSPDGVNWTNIEGVYPGNGGYGGAPYDISSMIDDSSDVWVRCRLYDTTTWPVDGPIFAQFLRTNPGQTSPSFDLEVSGVAVPEPNTFVLLGVGAISLVAYSWRRRRHPRHTAARRRGI